jgi:hypothetical protein
MLRRSFFPRSPALRGKAKLRGVSKKKQRPPAQSASKKSVSVRVSQKNAKIRKKTKKNQKKHKKTQKNNKKRENLRIFTNIYEMAYNASSKLITFV